MFLNILVGFLRLFLPLITYGALEVLPPPAPPVVPTPPTVEVTQEITAMSFNIYMQPDTREARTNGVVRTILNEKPDSAGLQEATDAWRKDLRRNQALKENNYAMAANKGRIFGFDEGAPILYNAEKYELLEEGVFWLSPRPKRTTRGWDADLPRITAYAVLKNKTTGFTYMHVNAHFDHMGPIARANSAVLVADFINTKNLPTVFTADVNATPDSTPAEYLRAGGLRDLRDEADTADTGATFHGYRDAGSPIDYVMANHYLRKAAEFKVIRDEYDGAYPSDHYAVAGKFTLAAAGN